MTSTIGALRRRAVARRPASIGLLLALVFLALVVIAAVRPELFAPADPLRVDLTHTDAAPSFGHPLGTDQLGRGVWTRLVHGTRLSLFIGAAATTVAVVIGVPLGLLAGLGNRVLDAALSRLFDLFGAFPEILLALVLIAIVGSGTTNLVVAIGVAAAPRFARVMRAETKVVVESEYLTQARLLIRSRALLVLRHVLPNAIGTLPVLITLGLGTAILGTAALSFLGFGPQPPTPEWGAMLAESRDDLRIAWWSALFPGVAITATVIATTAVGHEVRRRFERREGR
ncbi:ABC transporter permease [Nocardia miyunensis]|uniref:ABC transporter permease n=1 Tax=Nocardia miyunensis TaxID=282684 RepID=UPI00082E2CA3|nr:ABC transporter permease [Nocardia miyunensis]